MLSFVRSTIFNLCFYILTAFSCIILLPTLFFPRKAFLAVVHGFVSINTLLEKYILGLSYEVRGKEHLPKEGSYIVAAKHQSAYETFKLHILFNDPAIVLKKELLKIPLWGKYLAKSDVIAIDRSSPKVAIESIKQGAKRVAAQGRPIIIFPQGTRVAPEISTQEKPYKIGIIRMQEATNLPIIPLALNSGIFYPKNKWCKKSGKVIFEFLPQITPEEKIGDTLKQLEMKLEEKTSHLMQEAQKNMQANKHSKIKIAIILTVILFSAAYITNWFIAANITKNAVIDFLTDIKSSPSVTRFQISEPKISGFPAKLHISMGRQEIDTRYGNISIAEINAQSWPVLGMPINLHASNIIISMPQWKESMTYQRLDALLTYKNDALNIDYATLIATETTGEVAGNIYFYEQDYPKIDLDLKIKNYAPLLFEMVEKKVIKEKPAMFATMAMKALEQDGIVKTTIRSNDNKIYLGPLKVLELPKIRR